MSETAPCEKEELYDVIAALSANIRELTTEIVELHDILYHLPRRIYNYIQEANQ